MKHELFLTMIDCKVAQVLTHTPSGSTCTICGATPRQMNDLTKVTSRPDNENVYQYIECLDSLYGNGITYFICITYITLFYGQPQVKKREVKSKKRKPKYKNVSEGVGIDHRQTTARK